MRDRQEATSLLVQLRPGAAGPGEARARLENVIRIYKISAKRLIGAIGDFSFERKPFPAYIALIFGLFGEVVQHFNDFIFQRAKKHSLHHQIDFGILGVFSVNANTKKRPFQLENDRLYIDEFNFRVSAISATAYIAPLSRWCMKCLCGRPTNA